MRYLRRNPDLALWAVCALGFAVVVLFAALLPVVAR